MTWSYSGDPSYSDLNHVRFLITDTDQSDMLLQDEEINFALSVEGKVRGAAALCCEVISRNFARKVDKSIGPTKVSYGNRTTQFNKLAIELRTSVTNLALPYAGGLSYSEKVEDAADLDLIPAKFDVGMMSNK